MAAEADYEHRLTGLNQGEVVGLDDLINDRVRNAKLFHAVCKSAGWESIDETSALCQRPRKQSLPALASPKMIGDQRLGRIRFETSSDHRTVVG